MKITITLKRWRITISNIKKAAPAEPKSGKAVKPESLNG